MMEGPKVIEMCGSPLVLERVSDTTLILVAADGREMIRFQNLRKPEPGEPYVYVDCHERAKKRRAYDKERYGV